MTCMHACRFNSTDTTSMSGHGVADVSTDTVTDENSNRGIVRVIMLSCHGESAWSISAAGNVRRLLCHYHAPVL